MAPEVPVDVNISAWSDGHVQAKIQQYGVQDVQVLRRKLAQLRMAERDLF